MGILSFPKVKSIFKFDHQNIGRVLLYLCNQSQHFVFYLYPLYFQGFVKMKNDTNTETTTSKNVDENNETTKEAKDNGVVHSNTKMDCKHH